MPTEISSPDGETLAIDKQMDNYNFSISFSTVQEDNKENYLLLKGQKFVGEYNPHIRKLRISTDQGKVEFRLAKDEHRKFVKGLDMIKAGEELPTTL